MRDSSRSWRRHIRKFRTLSASDSLLLIACVPLVAAVRVGLWVFSYKAVKRWIPDDTSGLPAGAEEARRIGWSVRNAARLVPQASCLTQAMAAQFLLARRGLRSQIRVGVAKDPRGNLLAHAWLVSNDSIVVGGSSRDVARYALLTELDARTP